MARFPMNGSRSNERRAPPRGLMTVPCMLILLGCCAILVSPIAAAQQSFSVRSGTPVGGVMVLPDAKASDGATAPLLKEGQGVSFSGLPKATKLAIRYASLEAGTLSILINDQPAKRIHVHSSGSLEGSFLQAVIGIEIPAGAELTVARLAGDPAQVDPDKALWLVDGKWQPWKGDACVALDGIAVGDAGAGFPTDIWNLPPLHIAEGPYPPIGRGLPADTSFLPGGGKRSSGRGPTGIPSRCRSRGIGMPATCMAGEAGS